MSTLELTLPDSLKDFLETQASATGYGSASEYIGALLRELQKRQAWDNLEAAALEGLSSPAQEMGAADWGQLREIIDRVESQRASS